MGDRVFIVGLVILFFVFGVGMGIKWDKVVQRQRTGVCPSSSTAVASALTKDERSSFQVSDRRGFTARVGTKLELLGSRTRTTATVIDIMLDDLWIQDDSTGIILHYTPNDFTYRSWWVVDGHTPPGMQKLYAELQDDQLKHRDK